MLVHLLLSFEQMEPFSPFKKYVNGQALEQKSPSLSIGKLSSYQLHSVIFQCVIN